MRRATRGRGHARGASLLEAIIGLVLVSFLVTGLMNEWTEGIVVRARKAMVAHEATVLTRFAEQAHAWTVANPVPAGGTAIFVDQLIAAGLLPAGSPTESPLGRPLMAVAYRQTIANEDNIVLEAGALGPFDGPALRRYRIGIAAESALPTFVSRAALARSLTLNARGARVVATGDLEVIDANTAHVITADGRRPVRNNFAATWLGFGGAPGPTTTNIIVIERRTRF